MLPEICWMHNKGRTGICLLTGRMFVAVLHENAGDCFTETWNDRIKDRAKIGSGLGLGFQHTLDCRYRRRIWVKLQWLNTHIHTHHAALCSLGHGLRTFTQTWTYISAHTWLPTQTPDLSVTAVAAHTPHATLCSLGHGLHTFTQGRPFPQHQEATFPPFLSPPFP